MFKLDRKLIISASAVTVAALFAAGCVEGKATPAGELTMNGKPTIDGGTYNPVANGMTGPYAVNTNAHDLTLNHGRRATANEIAAWDKDVTPTSPPPPGSGTVEEGEELYEAQCVMCHGDFGSGGGGYPALSKGNAYKLQKTLTNQRDKPDNEGPVRVFGSYWPEASTMWWYIQSGMPHPNTKSLSDDETYALTAYMLSINELRVDGEVVEDDDFELNQDNFGKIEMPNKNGFEPNIDGPGALEDVRAYYANPTNFGAIKVNPSERCMKDCQEPTAKVVRIKEGGGIRDFLPPISTVRDLPKKEGGFDAKAAYEANCAMCHSSFLAPGSSDWAGYTGKGIAKVYANGINGTEGGMPAKGGSSLTDAQFKSVVDYLIAGK
jgi:S-disulfanyl-L-cysteine oxidoreductase SoxD